MSLQLFDVPSVDYRYEASREVEFQPALTGIQPITFSIPGSDDYYDINSLRFKVKVRLTDPAAGYTGLHAGLLISDGDETRHVYCVNNFAHSIFRDITLSMNGVLMTEQSNTYHYRAYLETLLNFNRQEGATKLVPQGWVNQLDVVEVMGATAANSDVPTAAGWKGNTDLRALTSKLLSRHWHTFIIRPHLAPLRTGKLLVPNVQMDFELFLNPQQRLPDRYPQQRHLDHQEISCHSPRRHQSHLADEKSDPECQRLCETAERKTAGQTDCPLPRGAERNPYVFL